MKESQEIKKLKYLLKQISKQNSEKDLDEILCYSEFNLIDHWGQRSDPNLYNLEIKINPEVYAKNYNNISRYEGILSKRINDSSELTIDKLEILPNYEKLQIINSEIFPVITEWEEINQYQKKLLEDFERSTDSIDFQNLGNTARTIMIKLAREVFDPKKHTPIDSSKEVNNGKYKNQLHAYIDKVLSGAQNKEYRKLAESSIEFVERSIDFMNTTTHKSEAKKHFVEVCVISTMNAISIVKLIKELE